MNKKFWIQQGIKPIKKVKMSEINTQYMKNPDRVYIFKMEYVSKINIFGLKMMV